MIDFGRKLSTCFEKIGLDRYKVIRIQDQEGYNKHKWTIPDLLNLRYNTTFDHHNWLHYKESDEVAYFLNEAGNNVFHYCGFPFQFHVWFGKKGFVIGISQEKEFNAVEINENRVFQTEGRGFEFYRSCKSVVFFDDPKNVKCVYFEYLLE